MKTRTKEEDRAKKGAAKKKAAERNCTGDKKSACGYNRFKTVEKKNGVRLKVACRNCGTVRDVVEFEKAKAEVAKAA